jgi:hypothetical protein
MYLREREDGVVWTGSMWLRIGSSGGLLWTWKWTFGFHKIWKILQWLSNWWLFKKNSVSWS